MTTSTTWTFALTAILVTAAWAGCLGSQDDSTDPGAPGGPPSGDAEPTTIPWGLSGCQVVIAAIPVDSDAMAERLPEGFTPQTPEEFGLPPHPTADAVLGMETFACQAGQGLNGTVDGMAYGSIFTPVHPPADRDTDRPLEFVKWETLVPDADRRTLLAEAGLPVVDGSTDLSGFQALPTGGFAFSVSLDLGGEVHTFTGTAAAPSEDLTGTVPFIEWVPATGGLATFETDATAEMLQGTGIVQVASGSFPAEIVGAQEAQAFMLGADSVVFANGTITLPG